MKYKKVYEKSSKIVFDILVVVSWKINHNSDQEFALSSRGNVRAE